MLAVQASFMTGLRIGLLALGALVVVTIVAGLTLRDLDTATSD